MAQAIVTSDGNEPRKKTDWQLFTNDGKFNSKLPPSQRLHMHKDYKVIIIPKIQTDKVKPTKPQPQVEHVENFIVIWLDQSTGKVKDHQKSKSQLQQVANSVEIFVNPEQCNAFMSSIKDEKMFVILSGTSNESFVSSIHDAKQLEYIYILSPHEKKEETWISKYPEIKGIFNTLLSLCEQLGKDVKKLDHNLLGFVLMEQSLSNITSKANQQEALFMYDQLFRDIVLAVKDENMQDMYQFCEKQYRGIPEEQAFLKMFKQQYFSYSPAWWYSQEAFLYRMLNKALRAHQYDMLYLLRVFTRHLHEQIAAKQKEEPIGDRKLFRGQGMDKDDFDRISKNSGGLLCVSNFLSTSLEREVGLRFAREALNDQRKVSILMEITVEKNATVPVANISDVSAYKTEKEWLFSMGSVFRVGSLERLPEGIWVMPLTLTDDQDKQVTALKDHFKQSMSDRNVCLNFAKLMHQLAAWKKSEYFYRMALETETGWQRRSALFNNIAMVKGEMDQYDEALTYYLKSLKLEEANESVCKVDKATTYNNIATLYYKQNKTDQASKYFQQAIQECDAQGNANKELVATLHLNLATILRDQSKYEEALVKCNETLRIRTEIFPAIHPSLASTYGTIASIMYGMESYTQAVEFGQKALDIDRQALPPDHPQTTLHMNNLQIYKKHTNDS